MTDTRDIDPQEILDWMDRVFHVSEYEGDIIWVVPPKSHPRMFRKSAGSSRPTHNGKRYVCIKKDRRVFRRSWLMFLWVHKRWPQECIDHIDGNSTNDRIENLREATITENAWNHKKRARRIQLPMGVRLTKYGRYHARIACNKKLIAIGTFDTPDAAHQAYLEKRKELFGDYCGL